MEEIFESSNFQTKRQEPEAIELSSGKHNPSLCIGDKKVVGTRKYRRDPNSL